MEVAIIPSHGIMAVHRNHKAGEFKIKLICMGDSITYGFGLSDLEMRWSDITARCQRQVFGQQADGLHPNEEGHRLMADALCRALQAE